MWGKEPCMITKIGPNLWQIKISVRVAGKDYPVSKRERFNGTRIEAEGRKAELIKAIRESGSGSFSAWQSIKHFSGLIALFAEKRGPFSPSHEGKINFLKEELGHLSIETFPDSFERYLKVMKNTPTVRGGKRSNHSLNRYVEIVRAAFGLAVELENIDRNPITKARFPRMEEKPRDRYLSADERLRLLNAIQEHRPYILPIIQYMLLVPCRKSELTSAKREQYNPFTSTIYIPDSKADIPIYKPVPAEMKRYFDSIPSDCPFLFYRLERGEYHGLGDFKKSWAFCLKEAKLQNVRIHDLRHISATDLYEAGNSERSIMDVAGWKTAMLSNYRHRDSFKSAQGIQFQRSPTAIEIPLPICV
jgi:integrase